ncbi:hypothetical protein NHX12_022375 [Muraenolepis orangiensis]|uniref:Uncharacterized protein n=1 Tax=Muraenolepis orangiensis TaxID=630683 RepID=A0A9Q0EMF9_9TELE|nr:hypothetical protein NHX12_022375 [Muraenolepis orangiensis]
MSQCRKRCRRQLTKLARYFYRFLTGTLTQGRGASAFISSLPRQELDVCSLVAGCCFREQDTNKLNGSLESEPVSGEEHQSADRTTQNPNHRTDVQEKRHQEKRHQEKRHQEKRHQEKRHQEKRHQEKRHQEKRHQEKRHQDTTHNEHEYVISACGFSLGTIGGAQVVPLGQTSIQLKDMCDCEPNTQTHVSGGTDTPYSKSVLYL